MPSTVGYPVCSLFILFIYPIYLYYCILQIAASYYLIYLLDLRLVRQLLPINWVSKITTKREKLKPGQAHLAHLVSSPDNIDGNYNEIKHLAGAKALGLQKSKETMKS